MDNGIALKDSKVIEGRLLQDILAETETTKEPDRRIKGTASGKVWCAVSLYPLDVA